MNESKSSTPNSDQKEQTPINEHLLNVMSEQQALIAADNRVIQLQQEQITILQEIIKRLEAGETS